MILSNYVKVYINNKHDIYKYKALGYNAIYGEEIDIEVKDLGKYSSFKIEVKCDYCSLTKFISIKRYNINTNFGILKYACSQKCSRDKNKKTLIKKYGVDNISKLESIKSKKIDTCIKNNGVSFPMQSKEIFNKSKKSKKERYNNENFNNKDKFIKTMLKNHGVEYPSQSRTIKIKQKISSIDYNRDRILDNTFYKDIGLIDYIGNDTYKIKCEQGHEYTTHYKLMYQRNKAKTTLCTICNPINRNISGFEIELSSWIKSIYKGEVLLSNRQIISPNEIDIYLPEIKIAIEFNGLYWHSEKYKDKKYHLNKYNSCIENGMELIQVWEDDWKYKKDIVKSIILNKIGINKHKIYARNCQIKEINNNKIVHDFLDKNHIQGYSKSKYKIGLFSKDELVSVMTFGKLRLPLNGRKSSDNSYEMIRYANKLNTIIIGGASKLFKYFNDIYKPNKVISYADVSYFNGKIYNNLGFKKDKSPEPGYYYIINDIKVHRFNFRKDKLVRLGNDSSLTEKEIMSNLGIERIWTPGNIKFIFSQNTS